MRLKMKFPRASYFTKKTIHLQFYLHEQMQFSISPLCQTVLVPYNQFMQKKERIRIEKKFIWTQKCISDKIKNHVVEYNKITYHCGAIQFREQSPRIISFILFWSFITKILTYSQIDLEAIYFVVVQNKLFRDIFCRI